MDDERIERALRQGPPEEPAYVPGVAGRLESDGRASPQTDTPPTDRTDGSPDLQVLRPDGVRLRRAGPTSRRSLPVASRPRSPLSSAACSSPRRWVPGPAATPSHLARSTGAPTCRRLDERSPSRTARHRPVGGRGLHRLRCRRRERHRRGARSRRVLSPPWRATTSRPPIGISCFRRHARASSGTGHERPVCLLADLARAPDRRRLSPTSPPLPRPASVSLQGSTGAAWLGGETSGDGTSVPAAASVVEAASDDACVAAVTDGRADAMVTATLLADELEVRGLHIVVPTPVATEAWSAMVGPGARQCDAASTR